MFGYGTEVAVVGSFSANLPLRTPNLDFEPHSCEAHYALPENWFIDLSGNPPKRLESWVDQARNQDSLEAKTPLPSQRH